MPAPRRPGDLQFFLTATPGAVNSCPRRQKTSGNAAGCGPTDDTAMRSVATAGCGAHAVAATRRGCRRASLRCFRPGSCPAVRCVEPPSAAFDLMEAQCPVYPLPQIPVLDRDHFPEELPLPLVGPPLGQSQCDAPVDVFARGDQRDAGRFGQRLEARGLRPTTPAARHSHAARRRRLRIARDRREIGGRTSSVPVVAADSTRNTTRNAVCSDSWQEDTQDRVRQWPGCLAAPEASCSWLSPAQAAIRNGSAPGAFTYRQASPRFSTLASRFVFPTR